MNGFVELRKTICHIVLFRSIFVLISQAVGSLVDDASSTLVYKAISLHDIEEFVHFMNFFLVFLCQQVLGRSFFVVS